MGLVETISEALVPEGSIALWWLGQTSFAVRGAGAIVYVDHT